MIPGAAEHGRVLDQARAWRGQVLALATVIETWRSAPCPVGTHMLIAADGQFTGSVSGGCVEGDVLQLGQEIIAGAGFAVRRYGLSDGAAWEVGLPCGGDIVVLVQPVTEAGFPPALFAAVDAARAEGRTLLIATDLETGKSAIVDAPCEGQFTNVYAPRRRLMIVGAVEIAAALAGIAIAMGIEPVIIDPRARFLTEARFPGVLRDDRWPDESIATLCPDSRTAIVTLSHDPKIDDPALIAALQSPAAYVGALGSKASHAARCKRLEAAGVDAIALQRIEGPAGVAINAISASEIALSIAGGMIRAFNHGLR